MLFFLLLFLWLLLFSLLFGTFFTSISSFLSYCFTYVRSILSLICIDDTIIVAFFDYIVILYSIHLTILAIKFALTVYNKLKI